MPTLPEGYPRTIGVKIDGQEVSFDPTTPAVVKAGEDRTYAPIRSVLMALGCAAKDEPNMWTFQYSSVKMELKIEVTVTNNIPTVKYNGNVVDLKSFLFTGRVYVQLDALCNLLQTYTLSWDKANNFAVMTSKKPMPIPVDKPINNVPDKPKKTNLDKYYRTFSGVDALAFLLFPSAAPVLLGTITTISYSMFREKVPVKIMSRITIPAYTKGLRYCAGTMIFTMINKHWVNEIKSQVAWLDYYGKIKADELPPFDVMIVCANEYGASASMMILAAEMVDEAQTLSIEDIFTENQFSFVAKDINVLDSDGTNKIDVPGPTSYFVQPIESIISLDMGSLRPEDIPTEEPIEVFDIKAQVINPGGAYLRKDPSETDINKIATLVNGAIVNIGGDDIGGWILCIATVWGIKVEGYMKTRDIKIQGVS